eukprot:Lithocolla_globosa_v1_NODE_4771_length_1370_cov_5.526996.p2 type:complete len:258 gc:universal NODE_4771_length_1370_cov_5.526996:456-1229(+)
MAGADVAVDDGRPTVVQVCHGLRHAAHNASPPVLGQPLFHQNIPKNCPWQRLCNQGRMSANQLSRFVESFEAGPIDFEDPRVADAIENISLLLEVVQTVGLCAQLQLLHSNRHTKERAFPHNPFVADDCFGVFLKRDLSIIDMPGVLFQNFLLFTGCVLYPSEEEAETAKIVLVGVLRKRPFIDEFLQQFLVSHVVLVGNLGTAKVDFLDLFLFVHDGVVEIVEEIKATVFDFLKLFLVVQDKHRDFLTIPRSERLD